MVGLGRFGMGLGFVGLTALGGGLTSPALADSFYLKDGQVIEGSVLKSTLNTLTLQARDGVRLTTVTQIERVVIKLADGSELSGGFVSWEDGVYELRTDDELLRVADGVLLEDPAETETAAPAEVESIETATETIAMQSLPNFRMKSGETLIGKILHATGSVLTIRPVGGSALPISRAQIETVSFETEGGETISGRLLGWENGIYRLQLDDDRELLADLPDDAARAPSSPQQAPAPASETLQAPVASDIEGTATDNADALPPEDADTPAADGEVLKSEAVGAGGPANEIEVAALTIDRAEEAAPSAAAGEAEGRHLIEALVEAVDEGGEAVVVKFQLSKPAVRPLVVLYAATEASAKAGEDFEAKSGVITFATGSSYAEVQVPIIDDDRGEDSEKFNLFLSGDPETIAFSERQITVTITDDD